MTWRRVTSSEVQQAWADIEAAGKPFVNGATGVALKARFGKVRQDDDGWLVPA